MTCDQTTSAELFDPSTGSWRLTGHIVGVPCVETENASSVLLPDGRVLLAGGNLQTSQLFDPSTGEWTPTANQPTNTNGDQTLTLLQDGRVLLAGVVFGGADLYDSDTNRWTPVANSDGGGFGGAVLLTSGEVLLTTHAGTELFDPVSNRFRVVTALPNTEGSSLVLLANGNALLVGGGQSQNGQVLSFPSAEYNRSTNSWTLTGSSTPRVLGTATLLRSGQVLVAAGEPGGSAELYTPLSEARRGPQCTLARAGTDALGRPFIKVAARDIANGLQSVKLVKASNATVQLPHFPPGSNDPAVATATSVDPTQRSSVTFQVTNTAGSTLTCDPTVVQLAVSSERPTVIRLGDVAGSEHVLKLTNGAPGLRRLGVLVNGRQYRLEHLSANEQEDLDISAALHAGTNNRVVLIAHGEPGSSAVVTLVD
jgi:hypothetical protein